ncbi:MAG: bis(5'-nucleosyl)-tetraphosphatase (symmetrical) YqeK [Bacilli bacterium]
MKNVVLYGGSFDPVHSKHVEIVEDLLLSYDEVWVIVAAASPFKLKHCASFENRIEMCKLVFTSDRVKILDVEQKYNLKYTYDVVYFLKQKYNYKFYFAIGGDNVRELYKWYEIEKLKKLVKFVIYKRTLISSTLVRIKKSSGVDEIDNYIKNNNLYINNYEDDFKKVSEVLSEHRFNHTIYVYTLIKELAIIHNLDVNKCILAAIYHDYYKEFDMKFYESFLEKFPKYKSFPKNILHGIMAGELLDLNNEVLNAIKYHTCGHNNPSKVLKALYLSDYLEKSREIHCEVKYILEEAYKDLDKAYGIAFRRRKLYEKERYGINKVIEAFINEEG